jgi:hypothetical protein
VRSGLIPGNKELTGKFPADKELYSFSQYFQQHITIRMWLSREKRAAPPGLDVSSTSYPALTRWAHTNAALRAGAVRFVRLRESDRGYDTDTYGARDFFRFPASPYALGSHKCRPSGWAVWFVRFRECQSWLRHTQLEALAPSLRSVGVQRLLREAWRRHGAPTRAVPTALGVSVDPFPSTSVLG